MTVVEIVAYPPQQSEKYGIQEESCIFTEHSQTGFENSTKGILVSSQVQPRPVNNLSQRVVTSELTPRKVIEVSDVKSDCGRDQCDDKFRNCRCSLLQLICVMVIAGTLSSLIVGLVIFWSLNKVKIDYKPGQLKVELECWPLQPQSSPLYNEGQNHKYDPYHSPRPLWFEALNSKSQTADRSEENYKAIMKPKSKVSKTCSVSCPPPQHCKTCLVPWKPMEVLGISQDEYDLCQQEESRSLSTKFVILSLEMMYFSTQKTNMVLVEVSSVGVRWKDVFTKAAEYLLAVHERNHLSHGFPLQCTGSLVICPNSCGVSDWNGREADLVPKYMMQKRYDGLQNNISHGSVNILFMSFDESFVQLWESGTGKFSRPVLVFRKPCSVIPVQLKNQHMFWWEHILSGQTSFQFQGHETASKDFKDAESNFTVDFTSLSMQGDSSQKPQRKKIKGHGSSGISCLSFSSMTVFLKICICLISGISTLAFVLLAIRQLSKISLTLITWFILKIFEKCVLGTGLPRLFRVLIVTLMMNDTGFMDLETEKCQQANDDFDSALHSASSKNSAPGHHVPWFTQHLIEQNLEGAAAVESGTGHDSVDPDHQIQRNAEGCDSFPGFRISEDRILRSRGLVARRLLDSTGSSPQMFVGDSRRASLQHQINYQDSMRSSNSAQAHSIPERFSLWRNGSNYFNKCLLEPQGLESHRNNLGPKNLSYIAQGPPGPQGLEPHGINIGPKDFSCIAQGPLEPQGLESFRNMSSIAEGHSAPKGLEPLRNNLGVMNLPCIALIPPGLQRLTLQSSIQEPRNLSCTAKQLPGLPESDRIEVDGKSDEQSDLIVSYRKSIVRTSYFPAGIYQGSKRDLQGFLRDVERVAVGSGILLNEASEVMHLNGINYRKGLQFHERKLPGKDVFICQDVQTEAFFVRKQVPLEMFIKRKQEVGIPLDHQDDCPWMITIYGMGKSGDGNREYVDIFMEYCAGGSIIPCKWNVKDVWVFCSKLLEVVIEMHTRDIAHGDLKPENICLRCGGDPGSLVLIDFESAKNPMYLPNLKATVQYLPTWWPDVKLHVEAQKWNDIYKSMDVWAIGVITNLLLSGCLAWQNVFYRFQRCQTCSLQSGSCQHDKERLMNHIHECGKDIVQYYPRCQMTSCDRRGYSLIHVIQGLLPPCGKTDQMTLEDALDILQLEGEFVAVQLVNRGHNYGNPVIIPKGTRVKKFAEIPLVKLLVNQIPTSKVGKFFYIEQNDKWMGLPGGYEIHTDSVLNVESSIG